MVDFGKVDKQTMNKLLVICGPTATGKTSLAVKLAKKFNGDLISADSRQVYKEMDIGTGKDHPKEMKIHLIDVVAPNQEFSVVQYANLAWKAIKDIWKREKLPIIVGGTGFYIKGVIDGIETLGVPPDWEMRWRLKDLPAQKLFEMLTQLDPEKAAQMNASDRKNPRRLIRAIEIAKWKMDNGEQKKFSILNSQFSILVVGLTAPYKILYQRIDKRVEERIKEGVEDEIRGLLNKGYSFVYSTLGVTIGYQEWQPYFEGRATQDEIIQRWKFAEHAYVRRQMTWFKKDKRINWFDINKKGWENGVEKLIKNWYTRTDDKEN